ncbi:ecdysteroid-regulated 16 kDa protein [Maniola jurtina]|uniref:ecdysteroid-regulated 16 kDa protein n=1 Tax=Maniola jurtina TaxID=191418 RepID=UPI001569B889|nr:ecdysteroid-regulated 16 kDa protein [Maniola hyperantus]XP_045774182.1 ecdysteroid-regulated 16 kDa protein [Maniola jurtina]
MLFQITIAVLVASAQAKFYTDCGSKLSSVQSVGVSGCLEDAKECVLKRNSNVTISVDFTPSVDIKSLETVVHGVIMNLPVPFPLPQPDACKDCGLTCPIKAGTKSSYKATFPILKSYPKVKVDVKWELQNGEDEDLVCVLIPARIH